VSFLVTGIAGSSFMPAPEQSYLWLALGMMWGVKKHLERLPAPVVAPTVTPRAAPPRWSPSTAHDFPSGVL
jgi:hypothetical protein